MARGEQEGQIDHAGCGARFDAVLKLGDGGGDID